MKHGQNAILLRKEHWVVVNKVKGEMEVFDSLHPRLQYNKNTCSLYCLFVAYLLGKGFKMTEIYQSIFSNNRKHNENTVYRFYKML